MKFGKIGVAGLALMVSGALMDVGVIMAVGDPAVLTRSQTVVAWCAAGLIIIGGMLVGKALPARPN